MGLDGLNWFVGVVEDRNDPSELGRCRVRILGLHSESKVDLPTEDLPWANVMLPTTTPSNSGLGTTPSFIVEGSWVVGFFMDAAKQQTIIMGTLPGVPENLADTSKGFNDPNGVYPKEVGESDVNKLARGTNTLDKTPDTVTGEPANPYAAVYPHNHVTQTESGHVIELDDTEGAERINIYHKSGTFLEMHPNGDIVTHLKNGFKTVTGDDNVHITGSATFTIDDTLNINAKQISMTAESGNVSFTSGDVVASNISLIGHQHVDTRGLIAGITTVPIGSSGGTVTDVNGNTITPPGADYSEASSSLAGQTIDFTGATITGFSLANDAVDQDAIADDAVGKDELKSVSTLLIKDSTGATLKTVHGAGD